MQPVQIDDFTQYKFLSGLTHSPDGRHACFVMHQIDYQANSYHSHLWLVELAGKRYFPLTAGSEQSFIWLDNETILFSSMRGVQDQHAGNTGETCTQYYQISIHGGEAQRAFRIPRQVTSLKMLNADTYLFTSGYEAQQQDLAAVTGTKNAKTPNVPDNKQDYKILAEIPFWSNGDGFTSKKRQRLYKYHVQSDQVEPITDTNTQVESFQLNPARTKAVIIANRFTDKMPLTNGLFIYDIAANTLFPLAEAVALRHDSAYFLTNDVLIYTGTEMKAYGMNENAHFYLRNLEAAESQCLTPTLDISITNSIASDCRYGNSALEQVDQGFLYFVSTESGSSFISRINRQGTIEKVIAGHRSIDAISVHAGKILFIGMQANTLQELFQLDHLVEKQITYANEWIQTKRQLVAPERICVKTHPSIPIDGWILRPTSFTATKQYPAILTIHGGPKAIYGTAFFHDMQYLAGMGYVVFCCNPRGSDGNGNAFADIRGQYGTSDYQDIMTFTDAVINQYPFIDPARLGIIGGSYGGYMTNWIIGHTNRFKAAVSERGIANWVSKFCTTDIGYYFVTDQITTTPWTDHEKLWRQSPLRYADQVKTPTLFLHAEEDYRCWLAEGLQMFTALKFHGVESRLCLFKGENHDISRSGKPKSRLKRLEEITEWFNTYLKCD